MKLQDTIQKVATLVIAIALVTASPAIVDKATASDECSTSDKVAEAGLAIVSMGTSVVSDASGYEQDVIGCDMLHGETSTDGVDTNETKQEISERAATLKQHVNHILDAQDNYLQDTQPIARLEAQAAYYRALENGSSRSAAESAADEAVRDYYSVKQEQIANAWNTYLNTWEQYESLENSEGISDQFVTVYSNYSTVSYASDIATSTKSGSKTTVNGTTVQFDYFDYDNSGGTYTQGPFKDSVARNWDFVAGYNDNTTTIQGPGMMTFENLWVEVAQQENEVINEMDTFINNTYDSYQQGDVNASDLFDASMFTRDFSASDNFTSWSTIALASIENVSPPKNVSNIGNFTVTWDGNTRTGMLLVDDEDTSKIESGKSYNTSNFSPDPRLIANGNWYTIPENTNFTIDEITGVDGESKQNVTVRQINYTTTNTSEFLELQEDYEEIRTELNEREESPSSSGILGGGGNGGFGLGDLTQTEKIAILGLIALTIIAMVSRDGN